MKSGEERMAYQYTLLSAGDRFMVQAWGDHDIPALGDLVTWPVRVQAYATGRGAPQYRLSLINDKDDGVF